MTDNLDRRVADGLAHGYTSVEWRGLACDLNDARLKRVEQVSRLRDLVVKAERELAEAQAEVAALRDWQATVTAAACEPDGGGLPFADVPAAIRQMRRERDAPLARAERMQHVCGASGFGLPGDVCPGCQRELLRRAERYAREREEARTRLEAFYSIVDWYRGMAERYAEDRHVLKQAARQRDEWKAAAKRERFRLERRRLAVYVLRAKWLHRQVVAVARVERELAGMRKVGLDLLDEYLEQRLRWDPKWRVEDYDDSAVLVRAREVFDAE